MKRLLLLFLLISPGLVLAESYNIKTDAGLYLRLNSAIPGMAYNRNTQEYIPWPTGGGSVAYRQPVTIDLPSTSTRIPADVTHKIPRGAVGRAGGAALKFLGPVGAITTAITLGQLVWDAGLGEWVLPSPGYDAQGDGFQNGYYWMRSHSSTAKYESGLAACVAESTQVNQYNDFRYNSAEHGDCKHATNGHWYQNWARKIACPANPDSSYPATCSPGGLNPPTIPATDAQINQAVEDGIGTDSNKAANVARAAAENGYPPQAEGTPEASGPASAPGPTSQTVSSGPAGQTIVNESVTYNISYAGDTVTIEQVVEQTTTAPDGQQTTTTTTNAPPPPASQPGGGVVAAPPPKEPIDLCKEHPEIVACQTLGEAPVEPVIPQQTVNVFLGADPVSGTCPADIMVPMPMGLGSTPLSWQPICDGATGIRPIVLGLAMLSAGLFVFRMAKG